MKKLDDEKLLALGLPAMQAKVYLAALELGEATIQTLARKSGINRSTIYTFIDEMKGKGYVFETRQGKRKIYSAVNPEHLLAVEKQRLNTLEHFLPELQAINNSSRIKPRVTYYEGLHGIKEVYKDMLREGKTIKAYEDLEHLREGLTTQMFSWFPAERAQHNIQIDAVSRDSATARAFSRDNEKLLRRTKFVKSKDFKTDINIYGDKIALMDLRSNNPFCVLIENKHLADTMRIIWQQLWDRLDDEKG